MCPFHCVVTGISSSAMSGAGRKRRRVPSCAHIPGSAKEGENSIGQSCEAFCEYCRGFCLVRASPPT